MSEHIVFNELHPVASDLRKTSIWQVQAKDGGLHLGYVKWFSRWYQYSFFPEGETVFEKTYLRDIATFCEERSKEQRAGWRKISAIEDARRRYYARHSRADEEPTHLLLTPEMAYGLQLWWESAATIKRYPNPTDEAHFRRGLEHQGTRVFLGTLLYGLKVASVNADEVLVFRE